MTIYKKKGNKTDCSNYRGITLLSIAGKAIARILLDRIVKHVANDFLPESQCGFRNNRGTSDMVFTLRQIQEKCREQQLGLYITFVDLTKAFDTVNRPALWDLLKRLGCPPKFLQMVIQLHDGQLGRVRIAGTLSKPFEIKNGVKQGCVLAPTLFSIFFSAVVNQAFTSTEDNGESVYIRTRSSGSLFDIKRLRSNTLVTTKIVRELLFADDAALVAHSERALQKITSCFVKATELFGLVVSLQKTVVLHQPSSQTPNPPPDIRVGDNTLTVVDSFPYLGSIITLDRKLDQT